MSPSHRPSHAFTTLWTADQVRRVRKAGLEGAALSITFGGPHLSAPSFRRAGVVPGDLVIPIHVKRGRLHVIAAMRVTEVLTAEAYVARHAADFEPTRTDPEFVRVRPHLTTADQEAVWLLRLWMGAHPEIDALCPGEASEVVLGEPVAPIRSDRAVPPAVVRDLRWQSGRRPERDIRHLTPDGIIERSLTLQGIYRLTPESRSALLASE